MQSDKLINHNDDLKRLWDEGCEIEVTEGLLVMNHIPYLNQNGNVNFGKIFCALELAGDITQKPNDHTVYFEGDSPCDKSGKVLDSIINSQQNQQFASNLRGNYYLSSKPEGGYTDYYDKMTTYANLISAPTSVEYKTFKVIDTTDNKEMVFNYFDTNSSRAKINQVSRKLTDLKIAIVGLGGTGSYILDLIAKTPVAEIHMFDGDWLKTHNAFRSPGAASIEKLRERPKKTEYFKEIYSCMHRNIHSHNYYIDNSNVDELAEMNFIFLSVDDGEAKKLIIDYLKEKEISFVDSGIGVGNVNDELFGIVRVTSSTERKNDHIENRISFVQEVGNEYDDNIQIADLNALNATMAVIKWKKFVGFYHDSKKENHSEYTVEFNLLTSEDYDA